MLDVQEDYWQRFNAHLDGMTYITEAEPDGKRIKLKKGENPYPWVRNNIGRPNPQSGYEGHLFQRDSDILISLTLESLA
jgi:hypothetical protein